MRKKGIKLLIGGCPMTIGVNIEKNYFEEKMPLK